MLAQWAWGLFETLMLVMMLILVINCVLIYIAILTMRGTADMYRANYIIGHAITHDAGVQTENP